MPGRRPRGLGSLAIVTGGAQVQAGTTPVDEHTAIAHLEAGQGEPLVLLPGWSQTAELFSAQLASLSSTHRVLALDHRGHGRSTTPATGYHLHRLAADVHALLVTLDLTGVHLLGHSMGCAVIWSYLELFGDERLASLVLVDQMPCALRNPSWTDAEAADAGATMDAAGLFAFTDALRGHGDDPRVAFLEPVTSDGITPWLVAQNETFDRTHAAELIFDVATHDWRTLLPTIDLPTLVVAGDSPNVPIASQRWMAGRIPDARFAEVPGRTGGSHFPFVERPDAFDDVVATHLAG